MYLLDTNILSELIKKRFLWIGAFTAIYNNPTPSSVDRHV